jgi:predicted transcriptional regulator of viral defense system
MKVEELFIKNGGQLRMSQALAEGISRYMLYSLRDRGVLAQVSRGVYRLSDLPALKDPDLAIVSLRHPKAVVCLTSALSFHDLTTQIPREVNLALPRGSRAPTIKYPPVRAFFFSRRSYAAGIEEHDIDGVRVRIYDAEKTIVDCFKFRNKIGVDIFLEALKLYRERGRVKPVRLLEYAKACEVEKAVRPYLEAML